MRSSCFHLKEYAKKMRPHLKCLYRVTNYIANDIRYSFYFDRLKLVHFRYAIQDLFCAQVYRVLYIKNWEPMMNLHVTKLSPSNVRDVGSLFNWIQSRVLRDLWWLLLSIQMQPEIIAIEDLKCYIRFSSGNKMRLQNLPRWYDMLGDMTLR